MPYKDYTTLCELRSGGTSRVYKVQDNDTGEIRAMKVTSFKEIQKLVWLNEIQMLQKLQYIRGVVKMYEFGELEDGNKELFGYAVLELCDEDLFEKPIIKTEQRGIFLFLYSILTQLHTLGYCYCDLKLENILRKGRGFRLCDFSSCQPIGTFTNVIYGTPHVIAPELLKSSEEKKDYFYDEKIDTWGLGCVLFELITGEQFDRLVVRERIQKISDPYFAPILQLCLEPNHLIRIRIWELSKKTSDLLETHKSVPMPAPALILLPTPTQAKPTPTQAKPNAMGIKTPLFVQRQLQKIRGPVKVTNTLNNARKRLRGRKLK